MNKLAVACAAFAVLLASGVQAGTIYWSGAVDEKWSTPGNWNGGKVPGESDTAVINKKVATTVEVDQDFTVNQVLFGLSSDVPPADGMFPMLTFTGSGTMTTKIASYAYDKRQVTFADKVKFHIPDLYMTSATNVVINVCDEGELFVKNYLDLYGYHRLNQSGGTIKAGRFVLTGHSEFNMTDGNFYVTGQSFTTCGTDAHVNITGGTFHNNTTIYQNDMAFLPKAKDATFVCTVANDNALWPKTGAGVAYDMPGKIIVTNASAGVAYVKNEYDVFWGGRGEIYTEVFRFGYPHRADLDLSKLCLGNMLYPGSTATDTRLDVYNGIEFGSFGDWNSDSDTRVASVWLHGPVKVNTTDCFDGETPHTVTFQNLFPMLTTALDVCGGGKAFLNVRRNVYAFDSVRVSSGATMSTAKSLRPIVTGAFAAEAGATVEIKAGTGMIESFASPAIDPAATVKVSLPDAPAAGAHYPVVSSGSGEAIDIGNFSIADAEPGAWQLKSEKGFVYLADGTEPEKTSDTDWIGVDGGVWNDGANWKGGVVPNGTDVMAMFKGKACTVVNDLEDGTLKIRGFDFGDGGPFVISGNRLVCCSDGLGGKTDAIMIKGAMPVTFNADIDTSSSVGWFTININANTYVQFNGDIKAQGWGGIGIIGEARFAGNVTCNCLYIWNSRDCRNSRAVILPGGKVTCKGQSTNGFLSGSLCICEDGEVTYTANNFYWTNSGARHEVNGRLNILSGASYNGTGDIYFDGTGVVSIAKTASKSAKEGTGSRTWFGSGLTFRPGDRWDTVTASAATNTVVLGVDSFATIAVTNDFAYGPTPDLATTTTAAQRAFRLPRPMCTLNLDVGNPDAGVQPVATFEDPIVGFGKIVKKGAGTLVLASEENAVTGGVSVVEGALTWTVPQTMPKLSVANGATLAFVASDGEPVPLTVESDLDLSDAALAPADASAAAVLSANYADVIVAAEGATLEGVPTVDRRYQVRIRDNRLQMRERPGSILLVR